MAQESWDALYVGLATGISIFFDFNEIFTIYEVFDADSKNLRIIKNFQLERAREQSFGADLARYLRPSLHEN